jgi:RNA polymerase-binding protein DksA
MEDQAMDQNTLNIIKNDLLNEREKVLKEIDKITGNEGRAVLKVKFPDYGTKTDEQAQEIDEYTKNLATEKVLVTTLRDIDNALNRIEKGSYGTCKYCHQPIGKKRLLARPVASTCIECKTKLQNAA